MADSWLNLPIPHSWTPAGRRAFLIFAQRLSEAPSEADRARMIRSGDAGVTAACHVLGDIVEQGWKIRVKGDAVAVRPPDEEADPGVEKERVRRQELLKRDEQLSKPSVGRFIADMERPREFLGSFVSIFSLMRDGRELAESLEAARTELDDGTAIWRRSIDPYVQVVSTGARCEHTGLRLIHVWRYFRHTWTNQYTSTPGRTMLLLVRDRAAPRHPVIGIAALGSAIVQIRERDEWIGWQPNEFLATLDQHPELHWARWVMRRLDSSVAEIYLDDLLEEGLYWPSLWDEPTDEAIEKLRKEAETRRRDHHRFARRADFKSASGAADVSVWRSRAESDLFRSKRCLALADLLRSRRALLPHLAPTPSRRGLAAALADTDARRAIGDVLRRAKGEAVGTEIADLTVCGAVAPYNVLLGGKLVSMLAVSPSVIRAYQERYGMYSSEIASSQAGRPIRRRSNLVFIGTTSLYGSSTSQYNRLRLPRSVLSATDDVFFRRLGKSRSFGTSHLSSESVSALVRLAEQSRTGVRVNSIFGEGVNPKLRKIRDGLDLLGWPSDGLLQHRRPRIVYGVSLVENLLPYLLGLDRTPRYVFRRNVANDVERIGSWWFERWLSKRVGSPEVLAAVREHTVDRPVQHGARVVRPARQLGRARSPAQTTTQSERTPRTPG
jgi:hypothetical protein